MCKRFLPFLFVAGLVATAVASSPTDSVSRVPTVAVMDFEGRSMPADEALTLSDRFRAELAACGGTRQVERAQMESILREQGFQQSGCTSTECAVQTGRILGVERIVSGSVSRIGETWTLHARVIDVGTAEILQTAIVDQRGEIDKLLTKGMAQLVERLTGGCREKPAKEIPAIPLAAPPSPPPQVEVPPAPVPDESREPWARGSDSGEVPFMFSVVAPVTVPRADRVNGIAVDLFYGRLASLRGVQAGLVNQVVGEVRGIQGGAINIAGDHFGVQGGVFNSSEELRGIQGGVLNVSTSSKGVQAGLVNITGKCRGIQFGLINIWKSPDGATWVFPFVGGIQ